MNIFAKTAVAAAAGGALAFTGASIATAQDGKEPKAREAVVKAEGTDGVVRAASADETGPRIGLAQAPESEVVIVAAGDDKPIAPSVVAKF
ncbi:hypothetical protein [Streptomyces sp. NPDC006879]|uniref:hypothetical protein n=1 Tax=Streptomyces sp. NPDC006879 TaxID=3364767 RepID=UPI0036CFF2B8